MFLGRSIFSIVERKKAHYNPECTIIESTWHATFPFLGKEHFTFQVTKISVHRGCRYPGMAEEAIAEACPVCRGNCNCKSCLRAEGCTIVSF